MTYVLEREAGRAYALAVPTLGQNIRRIRIAAGFATQKQLANAMGRESSQLVSDWERDRREGLDMSSLLAFVKACRVTIDDVIAGIDVEYDQMRAEAAKLTTPVIGDRVDSANLLAIGGVRDSTISLLIDERNAWKDKYNKLKDDIETSLIQYAEAVGATVTLAEAVPTSAGRERRSHARSAHKGTRQ